jgi:hypothetical protein
MSEADEVKRPKGSTSTKKSPDIGLSDTSLKQSRRRGYRGTRFAEGLGILTLHLVYNAGYGPRVCMGISVID